MRIVFVADVSMPPIDEMEADAVPRVGDLIRFYNIGDGADWEVTETYWRVGAYRTERPCNAVAHACVVIRPVGT